jgi:hypothetical protein
VRQTAAFAPVSSSLPKAIAGPRDATVSVASVNSYRWNELSRFSSLFQWEMQNAHLPKVSGQNAF